MTKGILLVSHVHALAEGVQKLLLEVAKDVPIATAAGLEDGGIGTSFEKIQKVIAEHPADEILAFYDLGSAKMNLEMAIELSEKTIHLYDTAFVESAYTAAALLEAQAELPAIEEQLDQMKIK
ncbi:MAG: dihydroxyacetone kinase phosphoryl donor subunit DhaM [Enterococcus sp.]